jgi:hypothetical protein
MRTRRWGELSQRQRKVLLAAAAVEAALKIAALVDMKKRPASEIRGPKWLWATSVTVVSSAGVLPVSYFLFGRRRHAER